MTSAHHDTLTPVYILTGFLGSGKTTLLKKLIAHDGMKDTMVLMNELGEIPLDHLVVKEITDEVVLLRSGCLCCSVRDDLTQTLIDLHHRRAAGDVPAFGRIVVETTGFADPTPIMLTLMSDDWIVRHYRSAGVITTVDATHGEAQLHRHGEASRQVALADSLVVTKADLETPDQVDALKRQLTGLNPGASILQATLDTCPPLKMLFANHPLQRDPAALLGQRWFQYDAPAADASPPDAGRYIAHRHGGRINTFCLVADGALDWLAFTDWLNLLLINRGERILRVKGLIGVAGQNWPVLVQGVQHVFYPPVRLDTWPSDDRRSRLVLITDGLSAEAILASFCEFQEDVHAVLV